MRARDLQYQDAADLMRVSVHTVRNWMKPSSASFASDGLVELLCLKTEHPLPPWIDAVDYVPPVPGEIAA